MNTRDKIHTFLKKELLYFDGAMGTMVQRALPGWNGCPELLNVEQADQLYKIHEQYLNAGSNFIETNTFGGNSLKLAEFGLDSRAEELNRAGVVLARKAADKHHRKNVWVAGSIGPTGRLLSPLGDLKFSEAVRSFRTHAEILIRSGVDVIIIETMSDLQEARAALLAVREADSSIFVIAQMTYETGYRTLTGTDPGTAAVVLEKLGADVIGANCSTGPAELVEVVRQISRTTSLPVSVQPNAGLPEMKDGKTVYSMKADDFGSLAPSLVEAGASILGGCCGTDPEFIVSMIGQIKDKRSDVPKISLPPGVVLTGRSRRIRIGPKDPVRLIGERINPTAQKLIAAELREGRYTALRQEAIGQTERGADLLDINAGEPSVSEKEVLPLAVKNAQAVSELPLVIDSGDPEAIEAALQVYCGRALINSVNGKESSWKILFPLAKKYGAACILLPVDETGVPEKAEERLDVADRLLQRALEAGLSHDDLIVDGLVMSVSTTQERALETLRALELVKQELGLPTVLGVSNVSFGLPQRRHVNASFLSMAIAAGLDCGILNPYPEEIHSVLFSGSVLTNRDRNAARYIGFFGGSGGGKDLVQKDKVKDGPARLHDAVLQGGKEEIGFLIEDLIADGKKPLDIINSILIPAVTEVGDLYESGTFFLPQLIQSAETVQSGFGVLRPLLEGQGGQMKKEKVILATVKGDVHDIGKKIVSVLLENGGFEVIDLGKDVPNETVLERALEEGVRVVGLSALMTTTMGEMEKMAKLIKKEKADIHLIVGGAAVTMGFAESIGAEYAKDAVSAVRKVKAMLQEIQT